ncbi:hypothetical protein P9112_010818 [Eukaryota sp. TZLM1-RC]
MLSLSPNYSPSQVCLLVCDIQERFRELLPNFETLLKCSRILIDVCKVLGINIVTTEQYPKALGHTVSELAPLIQEHPIFEKTCFSMITKDAESHLKSQNCGNFIIVGQETHVCVLQTVYDIIRIDPEAKVFIVAEAVDSQRKFDRDIALAELGKLDNVFIVSAQSLVFRLLGDAKHPQFKEVSKLAKELMDLVRPQ